MSIFFEPPVEDSLILLIFMFQFSFSIFVFAELIVKIQGLKILILFRKK
ncbi:hypothetical protein LEP1GSC062_4144 [Leptospira alexanderi serovar Manhao 3 str. L 60]|uniref:Uncharacterized protein n=1 Tax=Leptospira alexanderi serovar Manhao 3 str. L 60 TaxID=1049759 RepID=V6HVR9_9LEPT|nr:hypothetical protein LEP1GSC062_4144 [Leptospira alexanderi serovar Manhao 3 str. L 60]